MKWSPIWTDARAMGLSQLPLETWAVIAVIAGTGILLALRSLAVHLGHSLQVESLRVAAERLRTDQERRLRILLGKEEGQPGEVEVLDEEDEGVEAVGLIVEETDDQLANAA